MLLLIELNIEIQFGTMMRYDPIKDVLSIRLSNSIPDYFNGCSNKDTIETGSIIIHINLMFIDRDLFIRDLTNLNDTRLAERFIERDIDDLEW